MSNIPETLPSVKSRNFVLKDSPPEFIAASRVEPKGRTYDEEISQQPGAIRAEELVLGMKYASLAITDDNEGTLAKVSKANPWHAEALKIITGSEDEAHKPLSTILISHFDLTCDCIINESGFTSACHFLDTQGYIAHNDDTIVVAYRCTTSVFDWLTNLSTTSSAWEIERDFAAGHSGYISCLDGQLCLRCPGDDYKPRVHTGFYNNFLATLPMIKEYVEPLLQPDQPPRKLYVVGHSLGAGIATMAACYFLLEHDWTQLPQKLVVVTAGSPRACLGSMVERISEEMKKLRPLDKAVICRIVRNKDAVPGVPPRIFGFRHLDKLVYITPDGDILVNPSLEKEDVIDKREMEELMKHNPSLEIQQATSANSSEDDGENSTTKISSYERKIALIPAPLRDHMPDFYLKPLLKMFEKDAAENQECEESEKDTETEQSVEDDLEPIVEIKPSTNRSSRRRIFGLFSRRRRGSQRSSVAV